MSSIEDLDAAARMAHSYLSDRKIIAEVDAALAAKRARIDESFDVLNRANDWTKNNRRISASTALKRYFELADYMDDITAHMDAQSNMLARSVLTELNQRAFAAVGHDVMSRLMALHLIAMTPELSEQTRSAARADLNRAIASAKSVSR